LPINIITKISNSLPITIRVTIRLTFWQQKKNKLNYTVYIKSTFDLTFQTTIHVNYHLAVNNVSLCKALMSAVIVLASTIIKIHFTG